MKRTTWIKGWLAIALATAIVLSHLPSLAAQEEDSTGSVAAVEGVEPTNEVTATAVSESASNAEATSTASQATTQRRNRGPVVVIGGSAETKENENAEVVVAIGGSATAGGDVRDAVVAIGGEALAKGRVGDAVVAIAGNAEAQGEVGDAVVAVLGNVRIGPRSSVRGDVVSVGGKVEVSEGAQIRGQVVEVGVDQVPFLLPLKGLADWFRNCVLRMRLLAPQAGWAWLIAGVYLVMYLLVALAFPRPVAACVNELTQRPATTFLLGLLTKLLIPLVLLVLTITGIGVFIVPFVLVAVFFGALVGKAALLEYLGRQLVRGFGITVSAPILALLVGWILISLLYMVPILSLLVFGITGIWAIGVAVTAAFGGARKETPSAPSPTPTAPTPMGAAPSTPGIAPMPISHVAPVATETTGQTPPEQLKDQASPGPQTTQPSPVVAAIPEALSLKRAGFWERMAAGFLDIIAVSILGHFVGGPPWGFVVALAYFAGMWTWKGTTLGGIVLNLKVVRYDGRPVDFAVSLVRALCAAFSIVVLFLGFLWIAFDREKQGWHDKIAGTVVVRVPRATPLVCL